MDDKCVGLEYRKIEKWFKAWKLYLYRNACICNVCIFKNAEMLEKTKIISVNGNLTSKNTCNVAMGRGRRFV